MFKQIRSYFSNSELLLWGISAAAVFAAFLLFDRENYMVLCASLIGVTYLIFNAKGNPVGQVLVIIVVRQHDRVRVQSLAQAPGERGLARPAAARDRDYQRFARCCHFRISHVDIPPSSKIPFSVV